MRKQRILAKCVDDAFLVMITKNKPIDYQKQCSVPRFNECTGDAVESLHVS